MSTKTITLYPTSWRIRDEPGATLIWVPTSGAASMLAAADSDRANSSSGGVGGDSDAIDAITFYDAATSALPSFESDARNAVLNVSMRMAATDGVKTTEVSVFIVADGAVEQMYPFAEIGPSSGPYTRQSEHLSVDLLNSLAAGDFFVAMIFPARPPGSAASMYWDSVSLSLTYDYGPFTTPNPFHFNDVAAVGSTLTESNVVAISGITVPANVVLTGAAGAQWRKNAGAYGSAPGTVVNGDTVQLRVTSDATVGAFKDVTLTIETRADTWRVTTGSDVPTLGLNPPTDLVNAIPNLQIPSALIVGSDKSWQPRGHTIPMPFSFAASPWPVQYRVGTTSTGPWIDGSVPGTVPVNNNIYIRTMTPPSGATSVTVRLTYSSSNLTDDLVISTAAEAFVYSLDLTPVNSFSADVAGGTITWIPAPAGTGHHTSIETPSRATGVGGATRRSKYNVAEQWRLPDMTAYAWPVGSKIVGIGYGGDRNQFYSLATNNSTSDFFSRNPGVTTFAALPTSDPTRSNGVVVLQASPGIIPTGWTQPTLDAAIKNDQFAFARQAVLSIGVGQDGYVELRSHILRVFFQVIKPPEGHVWEI